MTALRPALEPLAETAYNEFSTGQHWQLVSPAVPGLLVRHGRGSPWLTRPLMLPCLALPFVIT